MSAGLGFGDDGAMQPAQPRHEAAECSFRCGYLSHGEDLADHERHEHVTCPECGREPIGNYPVSHKPGCARLRTRHPVTGIGPANAAPRPSAAPHSPQSAGVAAGDGTDGPEPSQGTTAPGSVPEELIQPLARMLDEAHLDGCDENCTVQKGDFENAARAYLARALPAHEAMVRQRVAEELRTDAASHRRLAARRSGDMRGGLESRADTLERAAERITRGGQA